MRFRNYSRSDLEAMIRLDALCFTQPFQFDRQTMQLFAEEPGAIVWLADSGNPAELVAFVIVHLEGPVKACSAYVVTIDVAPRYRRSGIGADLLARAESAARTAAATQIVLHVAVSNTTAISFYEHQHYVRRGIARRFYREANEDAILFAKEL